MDLLISRMQVQAANALAGQHFIATTPVMQASMFAHALGREVKRMPTAVAVLHHDAQLLGEGGPGFYGRFHAQQRRGAAFIDDTDYSSKNAHALSLQPTATAHLLLSIALRFDDAPVRSDVERFLSHARFSGGQVISHGDVVACGSEAVLLGLARSGYWLVERSDLVDPALPLESLLGALGQRPQKSAQADAPLIDAAAMPTAAALVAPDAAVEDEELEYGFEPDDDDEASQDEAPQDADAPRDPGTGWLAPAVLGYAATTSYARRAGVRADFLHAFAEPLVGLVQFVSVRQWRARRQGVPWWRHGWLADDVFVVSQNPDFLQSAQQKGQPA